jgi:hypothetical protein
VSALYAHAVELAAELRRVALALAYAPALGVRASLTARCSTVQERHHSQTQAAAAALDASQARVAELEAALVGTEDALAAERARSSRSAAHVRPGERVAPHVALAAAGTLSTTLDRLLGMAPAPSPPAATPTLAALRRAVSPAQPPASAAAAAVLPPTTPPAPAPEQQPDEHAEQAAEVGTGESSAAGHVRFSEDEQDEY